MQHEPVEPCQDNACATKHHNLPLALQIELREMPPTDALVLDEVLNEAIARPFNMATGPMIHATLIPVRQRHLGDPPEHTLVISTHYSVTDGWSMGVLFRDLSRAYNMLKLGEGTAAACGPVRGPALLSHACCSLQPTRRCRQSLKTQQQPCA